MSQGDERGAEIFESDVAPVLIRRCLVCHDGAQPKGGLTVSTRAGVITGGESGAAVVPGDPSHSLLLERIQNGEMPPDGETKLTPAEIAQVELWIKDGAPWPETRRLDRFDLPVDWWSFLPVKRPPIPQVAEETNPGTAIDAFIDKAIQQQSLQPSPVADRRTLLRRVYWDLVGLPPTPAEIDEFLADKRMDAWARLVDRLLASPQYGERWGRHWLDIVRYADTAGETADYPVPEAYRYRNYVVNSFNQDKPYDEFLREQIAGDIHARDAWMRGEYDPAKYAEWVTATGFLALSRRFGFDNERYEYLMIQDAIDNVGQVVQGLTLGCARCHDHKFDPVGTQDYYALYGILASTRYAFAGSERLPHVRAMVPLVPPDEAARRWQAWQQQIQTLREQVRRIKGDYELPVKPAALRPLTDSDGDFELQASPSGGSLGLPANPWQFQGTVRIEGSAQSPFTRDYPPGVNGAKIPEGQVEFSLGRGFVPEFPPKPRTLALPARWDAHAAAPLDPWPRDFRWSFDLRNTTAAPEEVGSYRVMVASRGDEKLQPFMEFFVSRDQLFVADADGVKALRDITVNEWYHVEVVVEARGKQYQGQVESSTGVKTFHGVLPADPLQSVIDHLQLDGQGHLPGPKPGCEVDNFTWSWDGAEPSASGTAVAAQQVNPVTPPSADTNVEALQQQIVSLLNQPPYPQAYAVWEGNPQNAPVQLRGEPERRGPVVPRRFLKALGGESLDDQDHQSGRLALATWLTSPENPLTARVLVNRLWQHHFGHGLVRTENDFGTRGQRPTHPELLDWLASEFMESGWSIKHIHRLIVLSQAYQRTSVALGDTEMRDPENRYWARFSRRRLDAECIRDGMLIVSGELNWSMPGAHPFPAYLQTRYSQHGPFRDEYPSQHRTIYLMTQRLKRHSFLTLFDGSDTNASTAKRSVSTVPPQALFMMNDPFVHQLSQQFARHLLDQVWSHERRLEHAFVATLGRLPEDRERSDCDEFMRRYRDQFVVQRSGESERVCQENVWGAFVRTLFARNEFVYVD